MGERMRRMAPVMAAMWLAQGASTAVAATDVDVLRGLHEKVIRAHRQSDVELLLEDEAVDYVVANRGEVTHPTLDERRKRSRWSSSAPGSSSIKRKTAGGGGLETYRTSNHSNGPPNISVNAPGVSRAVCD